MIIKRCRRASSGTSFSNNSGPRIGLGCGTAAVTSRTHEHGIRFTKFSGIIKSLNNKINLDLLGSLEMTFLKSRLGDRRRSDAQAERINRRNGIQALRGIMQQKTVR